jgi:tetrahydromethanopterin S-methyltransferase subunit B
LSLGRVGVSARRSDRRPALKEPTRGAELPGMGSFTNLLFGVLLGVAIVAAFWLLASFIDDLRDQTRDAGH